MKIIFKYWNTLKYLKNKQILGQIKKRLGFKGVLENYQPILSTTPQFNLLKKCISKNDSQIGISEFSFLNEIKKIDYPYNWSDESNGDLWNYNLHYFDYLNSANHSVSHDDQIKFISRWILENRPMNGIGWEPYPTSLRLVNWIKWSLNTNWNSKEFLKSMTIQARYLYENIEYHLLGNHLIANAKALIFAGIFFDDLESKKWFKKGMELLESELKEQINEDGGHFELSPMYHSIILEDLLDVYNLLQSYDHKLPYEWQEIITKMFSWISTMTHPDGRLSFFNDASCNIASTLFQLQDYAKLLDLEVKTNKERLLILEDSGYARIQGDNLYLIADIGNLGPDYLPGHAHADTLSFELSLFNKRFIVNSGTSTYADNLELRNFQRSTAAHSTLEINDLNSSEVWGVFRVAQRARIKDISSSHSDQSIEVEASHDGYCQLKGQPIHRRRWKALNDKLIIEDEVTGSGRHKASLRYHLHPGIEVKKNNESIELLFEGRIIILEILGLDKIDIMESKYYPEFGKEIPNTVIVCQTEELLPLKITTRISW